MTDTEKSLVYGPQPAPRDFLPGRGRAAYGNPPAPSQGNPAGNPHVRNQLAQGQYGSASRVPRHGVTGLTHLEHGITEQRPSQSVTLTAASAHPANALYQGEGGRPPTATLMCVNAAEAATAIGKPSDFRAAPAGAMGIAREPWHVAPGGDGNPAFHTPARPGGMAAIPLDTSRGGGQVQRPSTWAQLPEAARRFSGRAPGAEFTSRAPGDAA